ncbi:MAG: ACT domain-containing protein [Deltaproteobacteria bacterium]|nr:ACT domain-containing protein [Deltaproteobacteria bacterium]
MFARFVLTVIGPDRPGLVDALSASIARAGGSWQKSRMTRLSGHFAGIVEVHVPPSEVYALKDGLAALSDMGLTVHTLPAVDAAEAAPPRLAHLAFVGQDRPGLVQAIAHVLARSGVNVDELETHTFLAPMSGVQVFEADVDVHLPAGLDLDALRAELEAVARDLTVDMTLAPADAPADAGA